MILMWLRTPTMKVPSAEQMRAIDRRASEDFGIPSLALMQAAGEAFARGCVEELGGDAARKRIAMVCGRGNNGGDGFVAARHLANAGARVTVFLAGRAEELKGDAAIFFRPIARLGIPVRELTGTDQSYMPDEIHPAEYDLIGDALLGTGFRGEVEGDVANVIGRINLAWESEVPVVSADVPSGVNADTGAVNGPAVRATRTVTFAAPKMGLLLYPGAALAGRVTVADIGLPRALLENLAASAEMTTQEWMRGVLPPREQTRDANKGTFGTVLVIAGAAGMVGAAALSAVSALRAGAGLVQLAVPESAQDLAASLAPEVITKGLPETDERTHGGPGALEAALELAERADAVALGPGMGRNPDTALFVKELARQLSRPLVVDADGLNALSDAPDALRERAEPAVLTPHPGEMGRLLGKNTEAVQADRAGAARECAARFGAVALLKGARTLIAGPAAPGAGRLGVNRPGSAALATAGSGDVLTGVIAALLGQGLDAYDAARAGAYLHALAGELAAREMGTAGVIAGDVRDRLPRARRTLYEETVTDL